MIAGPFNFCRDSRIRTNDLVEMNHLLYHWTISPWSGVFYRGFSLICGSTTSTEILSAYPHSVQLGATGLPKYTSYKCWHRQEDSNLYPIFTPSYKTCCTTRKGRPECYHNYTIFIKWILATSYSIYWKISEAMPNISFYWEQRFQPRMDSLS